MAQNEIEEIQKAIAALENQRALLGDSVVDTAVAPLHEKLAALEAADRPDQQRKLVTTLFLDVVNSTAMVRDMDPEDHLAIMDGAMQRLTAPIEAGGGRVLKYMGDGLMALFGHPVARENDPEMAVHAALNMLALARDYAVEVEKQWGVPDFAVRIGMSTGMAIVGGGTEGENTVAGRHVNLAARLETAAPPGGLFISHSTYQQVRGLFEIVQQELITAKGFAEPQAAYRVVRARPRRYMQTPRGIEGVATRMIGRDMEMSSLQEAYTAVAEKGDGRLITIVGEAGIGKSRMLAEFAAWLEAHEQDMRIIQGKAYPQTQGAPYGLLRDLFTSEFAIQEDDSVEEVWRKFEAGFASILDDGEETTQKAHHVGQLLGFNFSASPYLQQTLANPRHLRKRALAYAGDYVITIAQTQIVVVFLEDLHWSDSSSLDALDHIFSKQTSLPVLVVAMTRPNLYQRVPDWGSKIGFQQRIDLLPLSGENSRLLVAEVLQNLDHVPDELLDIIVNNAEGNPFYAEELVKILIEEGIIVKTEPKWFVHAERIGEVHIPATLTGVIQARLDRLSPQDKVVIQQASVIGRTFWDDSVSYVYGGADKGLGNAAVAESLTTLQDRELIFPQPLSRFAGTVERSFKHALLRDIAYETVLKRLRREYHRLAANWLIENSGDRLDESAGLIAHHYSEAGLGQHAVPYWLKAGKQALQRSANVEAINHLNNGLASLESLPDTLERIQQEITLQIALGNALIAIKGYAAPEVRQTYTRARELCRQMGETPQLLPVLYGLWANYLVAAEHQTAYQLAQEFLDAARSQDDPSVVVAHRAMALSSLFLGKLTQARSHFDSIATLYNPEIHQALAFQYGQDPGASGLSIGTWAVWLLGYPEQSLVWAREAASHARRMSHPLSLAFGLTMGAIQFQYRREVEAAHEYIDEAIRLSDEHGFATWRTWGMSLHGWVLAEQGLVNEGATQIIESLSASRAQGTGLLHPYFLTLLAEIYGGMGRIAEGLGTLEKAMALAEQNEEGYWEAEMVRIQGELLQMLADKKLVADEITEMQGKFMEDSPESCFLKAIEIARKQEARSLELRATMSLGRLWASQGKRKEARAMLDEIYGWFTEGFDTADLQEARVLLDELT